MIGPNATRRIAATIIVAAIAALSWRAGYVSAHVDMLMQGVDDLRDTLYGIPRERAERPEHVPYVPRVEPQQQDWTAEIIVGGILLALVAIISVAIIYGG